MAKKQGGEKLHPLPFTTFGEIAALGFEIEVQAVIGRPRSTRRQGFERSGLCRGTVPLQRHAWPSD
jgi:hypothetical protein